MFLSAQKWLALAGLTLLATAASGAPQAQPGDVGLRHDIQVLADYGAITGPVTTWPIAWDAVRDELEARQAENNSSCVRQVRPSGFDRLAAGRSIPPQNSVR